MYNDPTVIFMIVFAVFAGALVKGVIGFGMPMIALPIIVFFLPPITSMLLLCAPIFITNFLQIKIKEGIKSYRFLPMFISLVVGLLVGVRLILEIDSNTITQIIALSIIFMVIANCFGLEVKNINKSSEKIITIFIGFFSGLLGGVSTIYGPPMLAYLAAVKLPKEIFVRTVSTMYFIGSFPLYGSLIYYGFATANDLLISIGLLVPALLGQKIGTRIRHIIPEKKFRLIVFVILVIIGLALLIKTF